MATRVALYDRWTVAGPASAVRRAILDFLEDEGITVEADDEGEIEGTQGSQLRTRLLGGWFVNARHLPKRVRITYQETEDGVRVRADIEESLGFGFMDPLLESKYERFFNEWLGEFGRAIR